MEPVTVWMAFSGGLLSFLSPCILPLAPGYLGIISGISAAELKPGANAKVAPGKRYRVLKATGAFILGFSSVFIIMGLTSSYLGQVLAGSRNIIMRFGGVLVILLGLHQAGWLRIPWLYREHRMAMGRSTGITGAFLTGIAFSFGWTPCVGPILGSILMLAGSRADLTAGTWLLIVYSSGLALPFMLLALAFERVSQGLNRLKPYLKYLEWASGLLLIFMGVLLLTGGFARLISWFMRFSGGWNPESILRK
jgi:cytochrome c-type biogenesis protein